MRFLYQIILGLVAFNALLILTAPFFPVTYVTETPYGAVNVTGGEGDISKYGNFTFDIWGFFFGAESNTGWVAAIFGVGTLAGIATAWYTKSPVPIGAAMAGSFISSIMLSANAVLRGITPDLYVQGMITIISILIGIGIAFLIMETMMQQGGAD